MNFRELSGPPPSPLLPPLPRPAHRFLLVLRLGTLSLALRPKVRVKTIVAGSREWGSPEPVWGACPDGCGDTPPFLLPSKNLSWQEAEFQGCPGEPVPYLADVEEAACPVCPSPGGQCGAGPEPPSPSTAGSTLTPVPSQGQEACVTVPAWPSPGYWSQRTQWAERQMGGVATVEWVGLCRDGRGHSMGGRSSW